MKNKKMTSEHIAEGKRRAAEFRPYWRCAPVTNTCPMSQTGFWNMRKWRLSLFLVISMNCPIPCPAPLVYTYNKRGLFLKK
jgi:hypothetical protein